MYKYAYFSISLLLSCCAKMDVMAQVTATSDMLMGKEWVAQFDVGNVPTQGCVYTSTKEITFMIVNGERYEVSADYYLSDSPVRSFNADRVGKNKSGKYIVVKSRVRDGENKPWYYKVSNFEILDISSQRLVVRNTQNAFIITYSCE